MNFPSCISGLLCPLLLVLTNLNVWFSLTSKSTVIPSHPSQKEVHAAQGKIPLYWPTHFCNSGSITFMDLVEASPDLGLGSD
ncbi:hypothetical protein D3C75_1225720 [compost metagenome]